MSDLKSNREVLEDWLQHPGTTLYFNHIEAEWGAGGKRFEGAVNTYADSREDDPAVLRKIQQIVVCRREILRLKEWPGEEVRRLKNLEGPPLPSNPRRSLPLELILSSRRGTL